MPRHPKALFRRGVAHFRRSAAVRPGGATWLDEAKDDLSEAATIEPQNREIRAELQARAPLRRPLHPGPRGTLCPANTAKGAHVAPRTTSRPPKGPLYTPSRPPLDPL